MNPLSYDLGNALLRRHRELCSKFTGNAEQVTEDLIRQTIISYGDLLGGIGAPKSLARGIGGYLAELAAWCNDRTPRVPPINALAVNGDFDMPGAGYYTAPGCGDDWKREVRECIACKDYPVQISD